MNMSICKIFTFSAAHYLPNYEGKCKNLHGHNFTLEVAVSSTHPKPLITEGPNQGMVMDFGDLAKAVQGRVIDILDHSLLNDIIENPTAENILIWIQGKLSVLPSHMLERMRLYETPGSFAELRP